MSLSTSVETHQKLKLQQKTLNDFRVSKVETAYVQSSHSSWKDANQLDLTS